MSQILIFAGAFACASGAAFFASSAFLTPGETPSIEIETGTPTKSTLVGGQLSSQNCAFLSQCTGNARTPGHSAQQSAQHSGATISLVPILIKAMLQRFTAAFK
ncbi:MAG: hypothetical protein ACLP7P_15165 [Rhodomicrobium sp.]